MFYIQTHMSTQSWLYKNTAMGSMTHWQLLITKKLSILSRSWKHVPLTW